MIIAFIAEMKWSRCSWFIPAEREELKALFCLTMTLVTMGRSER